MKLKSMKPAKITVRLRRAFKSVGERSNQQAGRAADKTNDLQPDPSDPVREDARRKRCRQSAAW